MARPYYGKEENRIISCRIELVSIHFLRYGWVDIKYRRRIPTKRVRGRPRKSSMVAQVAPNSVRLSENGHILYTDPDGRYWIYPLTPVQRQFTTAILSAEDGILDVVDARKVLGLSSRGSSPRSLKAFIAWWNTALTKSKMPIRISFTGKQYRFVFADSDEHVVVMFDDKRTKLDQQLTTDTTGHFVTRR